MSEKVVRVLVSTLVEFRTELSVEEAIREFEQSCTYDIGNTDNVEILNTEWRGTEKISYIEYNKSGTEVLLKPLKNDRLNSGTSETGSSTEISEGN